MNKHLRALKNLIYVGVPTLYFAYIPSAIVNYGIENKIPAFDNGAPFYEVYGVFLLTWVGGHIAAAVIIGALYMVTYGCQD